MKTDSPYDIITNHMNRLKREHPELRSYEDYKLLSLLAIKYFINNEAKFDLDAALESIVDGANDGGIDAITNDPQTDTNDIVYIQSKYLNKTKLTKDALVKDIIKITNGMECLERRKTEGLNQKLISAYFVAKEAEHAKGTPHILYFTTYSPAPKEAENLRAHVAEKFSAYDIQIYFGKEILTQIECTENVQPCIDSGKIEIDKTDNILGFGEDAILVNVSAKSLYDLYHLHQNGLFGMNLRYHVDNKDVDKDIQNTIRNCPETFWFKNNGITIVCDDFTIDGKMVRFRNFSIINGGQTTFKIAKSNIVQDFHLLCKIIKVQGKTEEERSEFATQIAQASNKQKPIKDSDLYTNAPEQLLLRQMLEKFNIYYVIKRGDKLSAKQLKRYAKPYQITDMNEVGKIVLASTLQLPGIARSTRKAMYHEYYDNIYRNPNYGIIADSLRILYFYEEYKKDIKKDKETSPKFKTVANNGAYWQVAAISLLCMLQREFIAKDVFVTALGSESDLKERFRKVRVGDKRLIVNSLMESEEKIAFFQIFDYITEEILLPKYNDEAEKYVDANKPELPVGNFYKLDSIYYRSVMESLWKKFSTSKESRRDTSKKSDLRKLIDKICVTDSY